MVRAVADEFLTDERDRKYYADNYSCCPPPFFIIIITLVEVSSYLNVRQAKRQCLDREIISSRKIESIQPIEANGFMIPKELLIASIESNELVASIKSIPLS